MDQYRRGRSTFPVIDAGPSDAEAVVLLHGFPQTAEAWSPVTGRLNAAGLRTLAPETRGTAAGARPSRRSDYRMDELVDDVLALLDAAGLRTVHLVGHDWGGGIAWAFAQQHPERLRTLTVLSTPHPAAMVWATRHSDQALRSWYMLAMQVPVLPEHVGARVLRRRGMASLGLPAAQAEAYTRRFSDPDALAGAIGLYRGLVARNTSGPGGDVATPTTYLWGRRDPYLGRVAAERTAEHCSGPYRFVELDADHWLPEKEPEKVASEILRRVGSDADEHDSGSAED